MSLASNLFMPVGRISRGRFFVIGVVLAAAKLAIDYAVATFFLHSPWQPIEYLWAKSPLAALSERSALREYSIFLIVAAPFAWVGVCLCCQRLRSISAPLWLSILFFVPVVKWFLFALLSILPERSSTPVPPPTLPRSVMEWIGATTLFGLILSLFSVEILRRYGSALFLATPFTLGLIATTLHGAVHQRSIGDSILVSFLTLLLVAAGLLIIAVEGAFCLVMAAPIAACEALLGSLVGQAIVSARHRLTTTVTPALVVLPMLLSIEPGTEENAGIRSVSTHIEIAAPADEVWQNVIGFSPIPEPRELIFRSGIAYPKFARIDGVGVGAVRHCVFSTGEFVEPITEWSPASRLAFNVSAQPDPLQELSPYGRVSAHHLHGYFQSVRGEFRLIAKSPMTTEVIGTTWYRSRVQPDIYWRIWSDSLIHAIHQRLLRHIKATSELYAASSISAR